MNVPAYFFMPYSALLCDGFMCAWAWRFGNGTNVRFVTLLRQVRNRAMAIKLAYNDAVLISVPPRMINYIDKIK